MSEKRTKSERAALIESALKIAVELGFTLPQRALLTGYRGDPGQNPEYLHRELAELGKGENVEQRCDLLVVFNAVLEKIGHTNAASKKRFMETEHYLCLHDETFRKWLNDGNLGRLEYAVAQLRYMST